jgi:protein-disulfide isomerase
MKDNFRMPVIIGAVGLIGIALLLVSGDSGTKNSVTDLNSTTPVAHQTHVRGALDAKVVLTEFGDFQCPACGSYEPIVKNITAHYGAQIKFEFKNFPLPMHGNAVAAAIAAEAAGLQGKFWEMHDELYAHQSEWSDVRDPNTKFTDYAKEIGLDTSKFSKDLTSPEVAGHVKSDMKEGENVNVAYTPYFLLNGKKLENPKTEADFNVVIETALKDAGTPYVAPAAGPNLPL